jgi:hypothetical protein
MKNADLYCKYYEEWSDAVIRKNSAKQIDTKHKLDQVAQDLKNDLENFVYPSQNISDHDFMSNLREFISFGMPATDQVTLPLDKCLDLEAMLKFIKNAADHPHKYKYDLWSNNCATMILNMLKRASSASNNHKLSKIFNIPWYFKLFNIPISPAYVMQRAARAAARTPEVCKFSTSPELESPSLKSASLVQPEPMHPRPKRRRGTAKQALEDDASSVQITPMFATRDLEADRDSLIAEAARKRRTFF